MKPAVRGRRGPEQGNLAHSTNSAQPLSAPVLTHHREPGYVTAEPGAAARSGVAPQLPGLESTQAAELAGSVRHPSANVARGALAGRRRPRAGTFIGRLRKLHATVNRSRW